MTYSSTNPMFNHLTDEQEEYFRRWARENNPPNMQNWAVYHPVCRDEWRRRGIGTDIPSDTDEKSAAQQRGCA